MFFLWRKGGKKAVKFTTNLVGADGSFGEHSLGASDLLQANAFDPTAGAT